jgi:hypothetical protein
MDTEKWRELRKKYDFLSEFQEGMAVAEKDGKYFHISERTGLPAYAERYDYVLHFVNGLAGVIVDDKSFHIRADGSPAYREKFIDVGSFHGDTALAQIIGGCWKRIYPNGAQASRWFENWEI